MGKSGGAVTPSLVALDGSVALLPLDAQKLLSPSVVTRPLQSEAPAIDVVMDYSLSNTSALLMRLLAVRAPVARVSQNGAG